MWIFILFISVILLTFFSPFIIFYFSIGDPN